MSISVNPSFLDIQPFTRQVGAEVVLPGSKSISNRALILAALSNGTVRLEQMLFSRDTEIMMAALKTLGFDLTSSRQDLTATIQGKGGQIPMREAELHVGNAGTAARFLTAFLALQKGGKYRMDGDEAMRRRPMSGLLRALEQQGARFQFEGEAGCFPFVMETSGLKGGALEVDASASSQILSALLMVAPFADTPLRIKLAGSTVSWPFVEITLTMLREFNLALHEVDQDGWFTIHKPQTTTPLSVYAIEPDLTAASYFMVLPLVHGGWIRFPQLKQPLEKIKQGDKLFASVLETLGVRIQTDANLGMTFSLPEAEAWKHHAVLAGDNPVNYDFNAFSDTFLTLAALAPLYPAALAIEGIAHTRKQETDRVAAMANELKKIGIAVQEEEDALRFPITKNFTPPTGLTEIETYEDHRVAMSFGILGTWDARGDGKPWLRILDPSCCRKTFPDFFQVLNQTLTNS